MFPDSTDRCWRNKWFFSLIWFNVFHQAPSWATLHEATCTHEIGDGISTIKGQLSTSFYACYNAEQSMTRTFNCPGMWTVQLGFRKCQLCQISFHQSESFFFFISRSNTSNSKASSFYVLFHLVLNLFTTSWVSLITAFTFFLWLVRWLLLIIFQYD